MTTLVKTFTPGLLALAVAFAVGCGSGDTPDKGGGGAKQLTIGFSAPELVTSFWISADYGVQEEAKQLGVKVVTVNAGAGDNANQQISQLQDLVQRHVDALVVGATNGDAIRSVVDQATAQGIPVVGLSSLPNSDRLASIVGADHYAMGKIQASCLGAAIDGAGKVGVLGGPAGQSWADDRIKGFKETLAKDFPGVKVVAVDRKAYDRNASVTAMEDWLQRFPDIGGVYTAYDDIAAGALDALKAAHKLGDVKVTTSNISPVAEQGLRSGGLACTSVQKIVEQGRQAVRQAVAAARKQPVEKDVVTTVVEVTKANLESTEYAPLRAPSDFKP